MEPRWIDYPREILNNWPRLSEELCETAYLSPKFNIEKAYKLLEAENQTSLITILLEWARDTHELYLFPYDTDMNLLPTIQTRLDKLTNKQVNQ